MKRLKNHVLTSGPRGSIALSFGQQTFVLPAALAKIFLQFRERLITGHFVTQRLPPELMHFLQSNDLLYLEVDGLRTIFSPEKAVAILSSAIEMWKPLPHFHPIFLAVHQKKLGLQVSFMLETLVFISHGSAYFDVAAANALDKTVKRTLRRLSKEERGHHVPLLDSLNLSAADLRQHDPLPGTEAILAFLFKIAYADPHSLLIVTALFETEGDQLPQIKKFYRALSRETGFNLESFYKHHAEDAGHGHSELWCTGILAQKNVDHGELSRWLRALHTCKHLIWLWYDSILNESAKWNLKKPISMKSVVRPAPRPESILLEHRHE